MFTPGDKHVLWRYSTVTLVKDNSSFSLNHNLITLKALNRWDLSEEEAATCRWGRDKTTVQTANAWPSLSQGSSSIYDETEGRAGHS